MVSLFIPSEAMIFVYLVLSFPFPSLDPFSGEILLLNVICLADPYFDFGEIGYFFTYFDYLIYVIFFCLSSLLFYSAIASFCLLSLGLFTRDPTPFSVSDFVFFIKGWFPPIGTETTVFFGEGIISCGLFL